MVGALEESHAQIEAALHHAGRVWREQLERALLETVGLLRHAARGEEGPDDLGDEARQWLGLLADALDDGEWGRLAI
jgi:hypothetical protein